jgi:ABC-type polysaccharide/polyol phosphate export permease
MKYAQLIRLLVNRELTLRYKRSVIGIGIGNPAEVVAAYEAV